MRRLRTSWPAAVIATGMLAASVIGPAVPVPAAAEEVEQQILGDFEAETAPWAPVVAGGATSTMNRTTAAARTGAASARWDVGVPAGGLAAIGRDVVNLDAIAVRLSVRTASADEVVLRLRDASGQTHQQRLAVTPSATQWTDLAVTDFDGGTGYSFFGGAADGVWHGPLTRVSLVVTPSELLTPPSGTLLVDDVVVDLPAGEFTVQPTELGNVFDEGRPVTVGFETSATSLAWRVFDHDGAQARTGSAAVAGLGGAFTIGTLPVGWYEVEITATRPDGTQFAAGTDVAVLPASDPVKDPRRGVGTHFGASGPRQWSPDVIPLIARAGFGFARDEAAWAQQETTKGQIVFTQKALDYTAAYAANGLDFMNILAYGNPLYHEYEAPVTQEGRDGFANYADASVAQFGTDDTVYEVWNEWNWRKLTEPAAGRADYYVDLLRTTSDRVRATHPDAKLIGPALSPALATWPQWIDEFIAEGGLEYIDAFSIHPYVQTTTPEATLAILTTVRQKLAAAGHADMPIVFSEQGWNTSTGEHHVTESVQSANLVRAQLLSLAEGVEQYAIYDFKDDGLDPAEKEHHFGIIGHEGDVRGAYRPKPAYVAQALMSRRINGRPALGWSELDDGVYDVRFQAAGGETVHALWSTGAPVTVALTSTGSVDVHGIHGGYEELVPDGTGRVYVDADTDPVFVTGPISAADVSARHSLSVSEAFTGAPATGTWAVDLTGSSTGFDGVITVGDQTTTATVAAGERAEIAVTLPPATRAGNRTWRATVSEGAATVARIGATAQARPTLEVTGSHALTADGDDVLRLRARNNSSAPATVDGVDWTVGAESGVAVGDQEIPAGGSRQVDVPVELVAPTSWGATLRAPSGDSAVDGTLRPAGDLSAAPSAPVDVDGEVDPVIGRLTATELPEPDTDGWGGAADLSGRLWWTHDAENLYLTAEVVDDTAAQPAMGANIWQGDSVQVGLVAGAPGEETRTHEVGVAVTDAGGIEVWRWGPRDLGSDLAGVRGAAARDDAAGTTTYELAIPFASLPAFRDDGLVAATVVVNENDGSGREGWATWGEGVAESKDAAKYNPLALSGPVPTGLTADPGALELPMGVAGGVTVAEDLSDGSTRDVTGDVTWTSSDTGVATVSADGRVAGVAAGTAVVAATSDAAVLEIPVTVTDATLRSIAVAPERRRVLMGAQLALTAIGHFSDGSTHELSEQVSWTSSSSRVATVDDGGVATAVAPGAATIGAALGAVAGTTILTVAPR